MWWCVVVDEFGHVAVAGAGRARLDVEPLGGVVEVFRRGRVRCFEHVAQVEAGEVGQRLAGVEVEVAADVVFTAAQQFDDLIQVDRHGRQVGLSSVWMWVWMSERAA